MTSREHGSFDSAVEQIAEKYNLTIEYPDDGDNGYLVIFQDDRKLGEMNTRGYDLAYNLLSFTSILADNGLFM